LDSWICGRILLSWSVLEVLWFFAELQAKELYISFQWIQVWIKYLFFNTVKSCITGTFYGQLPMTGCHP